MTERLNIEAYPLCWPAGWARAQWRRRSGFHVRSFAQSRDGLLHEIKLLTAKNVVLSTNIELRRDGLPYAQRAEPHDPGIAVYFQHDRKSMCFACDRFDRVRDNVRAIEKTIAAIRGIQRWGASDMMERAFTGFLQLPSPGMVTQRTWREVFEYGEEFASVEDVEKRFRKLARIHHPDRGGDHDRFAELQRAREQAREALA